MSVLLFDECGLLARRGRPLTLVILVAAVQSAVRRRSEPPHKPKFTIIAA
jgi:hypothetical protein